MSQKNRGSSWDDEEVFLPIEIGADKEIRQQLETCTKKTPSPSLPKNLSVADLFFKAKNFHENPP